MERIAICAGSFDPPTDGHLNIIKRGLQIFDRIIVAVAESLAKTPLFSPSERVSMLREIFRDVKGVEVDSFEGLVVEYARRRGGHTLLRGIRNMSDYEYESQMALANKTLAPEIETIYMMTEGKYAHVSSSILKEVITMGGAGLGMIHPIVEEKLRAKLKRGRKAER